MAHILLTFGCLFYNDHVLSLNLSFEWFLGYHPRKGYIRQKFVCFKSSIIEHSFAKNELNNSAFFLKSITNLFSLNKGGIIGVFLLFKNISKINQYALGDTRESLSWYSGIIPVS